MRAVLLLLIGGILCPGGPVAAQSLETEGTVTELSEDRIVVDRDPAVEVEDGDRGRVFTTVSLGQQDEQNIVAAAFTVDFVTGEIVFGRVTERSDLVDASVGQKVSFGEQAEAASEVPGFLVVRSTPSEARVDLVALEEGGRSSRELGRTPVRDSVAPGRYRVQVTKDQYTSVERTVRVRPAGTQTLRPSLESRVGALVVEPSPDSAKVMIDGEPAGRGVVEDTLMVGQHDVTVEASGYEAVSRSVNIKGESRKRLEPALDRKTTTLKVTSEPSGADVIVDKTTIGQTPITDERPTGEYNVEVVKSGFQTVTRPITLRGDEPQQIDVQLQRPIEVELGSGTGPVQNVEMDREEGNLLLKYALTGDEEAYDVELQLSDDGGANYDRISKELLQGDVGEEISPGSEKQMRWEVLQRYPEGLSGADYRVRIQAEEASQPGGFTLQAMTPSNDVPSFGGGAIGWTGEDWYLTLSYTKLIRIDGFRVEEVNSVGLRSGPVWRLGWFSLQPIFGVAVRGGDVVGQGGSGLYFGRTLYVGTELVYTRGFDEGKADLGAFLTLGLAL